MDLQIIFYPKYKTKYYEYHRTSDVEETWGGGREREDR